MEDVAGQSARPPLRRRPFERGPSAHRAGCHRACGPCTAVHAPPRPRPNECRSGPAAPTSIGRSDKASLGSKRTGSGMAPSAFGAGRGAVSYVVLPVQRTAIRQGFSTPWGLVLLTKCPQDRAIVGQHHSICRARGMADLPRGPWCVRAGSDLPGRRGGDPRGGFGVGQEQHLRLVGGASLDDVDAPGARAVPRRGPAIGASGCQVSAVTRTDLLTALSSRTSAHTTAGCESPGPPVTLANVWAPGRVTLGGACRPRVVRRAAGARRRRVARPPGGGGHSAVTFRSVPDSAATTPCWNGRRSPRSSRRPRTNARARHGAVRA